MIAHLPNDCEAGVKQHNKARRMVLQGLTSDTEITERHCLGEARTHVKTVRIQENLRLLQQLKTRRKLSFQILHNTECRNVLKPEACSQLQQTHIIKGRTKVIVCMNIGNGNSFGSLPLCGVK